MGYMLEEGDHGNLVLTITAMESFAVTALNGRITLTGPTRLRDLEKKATPAPWNLDMQFDPQDVLRNVKLETTLRNAAPWLLEAAACFQPGDAERIARIAREELLEGCCSQCDADVDMMHRLQKAAKIMEGME